MSVGFNSNLIGTDYATYLAEQANGIREANGLNNPNLFATEEASTMQADIDAINADLEASLAAISQTQATEEAEKSEETKKIEEEIKKLEEERKANLEEMEELEAEIKELAELAEENIVKAAALQEEAVKEHEKEAKAAVEENIAKYIEANKEGGPGMTQDALQANIKESLSATPEVGEAIAAMLKANEQIGQIDDCLSELNGLIADTQSIESQITAQKSALDASKEADKKAAEAKKSCDPIGFVATDAEGNEAQYDFIVDDGAFDSTSDFLGAEDQWAAMQALDTDGDNVVTTAELQAGNIKAVKTNEDGSQSVVDLASEFGEDFSIDLASYTEGGSHSAVDTTTDHDGDGVADQEMLGTFTVNANGQDVQGYNTLDDTEWLAEQFGLTADTTVDEAEAVTASEELQNHINFFETYTEKSAELKEALAEIGKEVDLTGEDFKEINAAAAANAKNEVDPAEETNETNADPASMTEEEKEELLKDKEVIAA